MLRVSVLILFVGVLLPSQLHGESVDSPISPVNLRCEYRVDPYGLDTAHPRLTWQAASEQRGAFQRAYRVIAASSPQALD